MKIVLILALVGYFFGSIHGSQIIGKIKNVDIKNNGVKNAGASNTTILLGWKFGILVALIDILKAVVPILVLYSVLDRILLDNHMLYTLVYLTGFFVIIGHIYPFTMKFNGGKGTASLVGLLLAIDWKVGLIGLACLLLFTFATDYLVIGVLFMYISFITTTILFDFGSNAVIMASVLTLISTFKHLENYQRIKNKTETKLSSMFKKKQR